MSLDAERKDSIVVWVFYIFLSLYNLFYFKSEILKLHERQFHLMMFGILQFCYICYIAEHSFRWTAS